MMPESYSPKTNIAWIGFSGGKFVHNGNPTRVSMTKEVITVGCSTITIEAARELLKLHDAHFGNNGTVVIQP